VAPQITGPVGALPSAADGFLQAVGWWYEEIDRYNYSKPGERRAWRVHMAVNVYL
jgi:hypothetical protein